MRRDAPGCEKISLLPSQRRYRSLFDWIPACSAPVAVFGAHSDIFSIHAFLPWAAS